MDQKDPSALSDHDRVRNEHIAWARAMPEREKRMQEAMEESQRLMQEHLDSKVMRTPSASSDVSPDFEDPFEQSASQGEVAKQGMRR